MKIELTLNNYRCFPASRPARFVIEPGWTALLGANNSGKSALLRLIYDLRLAFGMLANHSRMNDILSKQGQILNAFQGTVQDVVELVTGGQDGEPEIRLAADPGDEQLSPRSQVASLRLSPPQREVYLDQSLSWGVTGKGHERGISRYEMTRHHSEWQSRLKPHVGSGPLCGTLVA